MAAVHIDAEQLNKGIDKLISSLEKLDKTIAKSGERVLAFEKTFKNTINFDNFIKSVKALEAIGSRAFSTFSKSIISLAKDVKKATSIGKSLEDLSKQIVAFANNLSKINISDATVKNLKTIAIIIRAVLAITGKSKGSAIKGLVSIADGIKSVFKAFSEIKTGSGENSEMMRKVIKSIIDTIKGFAEVTKSASKMNKKQTLKLVLKIGAAMMAFSLMTNKMSASVNVAARLGNAMTIIAKALQQFMKISDTIKMSQVRKIILVFGALSLAFRVIGAVLSKLPGEGSLAEMSKVFDRLGRGLWSLSKVSKVTSKKDILKLLGTMTAIGLIFRVMSKVAGKGKNLSSIALLMKSMGILFKTIDKETGAEKSPGVARLKERMKALKDVIKDINKMKINKGKIGAIADMINSINNIKGTVAKGSQSGNGIARVFRNRLIENSADWLVNRLSKVGSAFNKLRQNIAGTMKSISADLKKFGLDAVRIGRVIERSFGLSKLAKTKPVSLAIDFDKISSELKTFGRLTDEQVKNAQAFADQIGIDYPLSANKALQAILSLKKAGQALGDIRNILPSAADISSLRDDQSIDAASKSLIAFAGGFGEFAEGVPASFDNIAVASDILAAGAVSSTASVDDLSAGLAKVAPSAKDAGIDMRDVAAALGLLDRAQIKGVAGGTALRGILNSLIRPKSLDELARLNVATLNADGSQRSLNQITTDLAESYDRLGFSQDQRNQSMAQIAEVESRAALSILVTNGGLSDQLALMDEVSTANELASQKIDNLAGDIGQLQGSIETFMKNAALPMISRFFRPIVKLARLVVDGLLQLPEAVLETASTMIFLGSAIATVTAATVVLIGVLSIVSGAFMSVVASVALLAFNLPAVIIGIAGIAGSLLVLIPVLTAIAALWIGLSHIITTAFRQIEGNINGAGDAFTSFKAAVATVVYELSQAFRSIAEIVMFFFNQVSFATSNRNESRVVSFFNSLTDKLRIFAQGLSGLNSLLSSFSLFLNSISSKDVFSNYVDSLSKLTDVPIVKKLFGEDVTTIELDKFFSNIKKTLANIVGAVKNVGQGLVAHIFGVGDTAQFSQGINSIVGMFISGVGKITNIDFASALFDIRSGKLIDGAQKFASTIITTIRSFLWNNREQISRILGDILNFIYNQFRLPEKVFRALGLDAIADGLNVIGDLVENALRGVIDVAVRLFAGESLLDIMLGSTAGGGFASSLAETLLEAVGFISERLSIVFGEIKSVLPAIIESVSSVGAKILSVGAKIIPMAEMIFSLVRKTFISFIPVLSAIIDAVVPFAATVISAFFKILDTIITTIGLAVVWVQVSLLPAISALVDIVVAAAIQIINAFSKIADAVIPILAEIVSYFITRLAPIIQNIITSIIIPAIGLLVNAFRLILSIATPIILGLAKAFEFAWPLIKVVLDGIFIAVDIIISVFGILINSVSQIFGVFAKLFTLISDVFLAIMNTVADPLLAVVNALSSAWDSMVIIILHGISLLTSALTTATNFITGIVNDILDAVSWLFDTVNDFASGIADKLGFNQSTLNVISGIFSLAGRLLKRFIDEMAVGISKIASDIRRLTGTSTSEDIKMRDIEAAFDIGGTSDEDIDRINEFVQATKDAGIEIGRVDDAISKGKWGLFQQLGFTKEEAETLVDSLDNVQDTIEGMGFNPDAMLRSGENFAAFADSMLSDDQLQGAMFDVLGRIIEGDPDSSSVRRKLRTLSDEIKDSFRELLASDDGLTALDQSTIANMISTFVASDTLEEAFILAAEDGKESFNALLRGLTSEQLLDDELIANIINTGISEGLLKAADSIPIIEEQGEALDDGAESARLYAEAVEKANEALAGGLIDAAEHTLLMSRIQDETAGIEELTDVIQILDNLSRSASLDGGNIIGSIINAASDVWNTAAEQVAEDIENLEASNAIADAVEKDILDAEAKIADFDLKESRRVRDEEKRITDKQASILKLQTDGDAAQIEKTNEFNQETEDQLVDHQNKLIEIDSNAHEKLEDAIGSRNAAAARSAIKERNKQLSNENADFNLSETRRKRDFEQELAQDAAKRAQRVLESQQELSDMRDQAELKRSERVSDFWRELGFKRDAEGALVKVAAQAAQAKADIEAQSAQSSISNADITKRIVGQVFSNIGQSAIVLLGQIAQLGQQNAVSTKPTLIGGGGRRDRFLIPGLATGGNILSDGIIKAHRGEKILNRDIAAQIDRKQPVGAFGNNLQLSISMENDFSGMSGGNPSDMVAAIEAKIIPKITKAVKNVVAGRDR